jgi:hypothetical protein
MQVRVILGIMGFAASVDLFFYVGVVLLYRILNEVNAGSAEADRINPWRFGLNWRMVEMMARHRLLYPHRTIRRRMFLLWGLGLVLFLASIFSNATLTSAR